MKYLKNLLKAFFITACCFLLLMFIFTVFNYFNIIGMKVMLVMKIIIPLFSLAVGGFFLGKLASKNGYLEGLKLGLIVVVIILFGNVIFKLNISLKDVVFYLSLIVSSMLGSMLGINKKKE